MIVDEIRIEYFHYNEMDKHGGHDPEFDTKVVDFMEKLGFRLVAKAYADEGDGVITLDFSS